MTPLSFKVQYDFLAFVANSFSVSEEDWLSETDLSDPPSSFRMFSLLLKELIFIFYNSVYLNLRRENNKEKSNSGEFSFSQLNQGQELQCILYVKLTLP